MVQHQVCQRNLFTSNACLGKLITTINRAPGDLPVGVFIFSYLSTCSQSSHGAQRGRYTRVLINDSPDSTQDVATYLVGEVKFV